MRVLFIVCAVLGTVGICGLLVMLLFFRLKINLGFKLPTGKTIPIEQFIPQGIYGYAVFMAVFGYFGLLLLPLSLPWCFIVPADIAMGLIVNFIGTHFISLAVKRFVNGKAPKPDDLTGYEATALENIGGNGYGKVRVKYEGISYRFDAISVYHTDIEAGEKVDVVTGEDELLFVQKKDEIYKILDEEQTPATKSESDKTPSPKRQNDSFVRTNKADTYKTEKEE